MSRSVPQLLSLAAIAVGVALFGVTLYFIDLDETLASVSRLGAALPVILLPGACWHLLRTWGWWIAFPDNARPSFTRLFRVRLAADAVGFFTVRGVAGEPLKVILLLGRVAPEVTAAAIAFERLAFAIVGVVIAGVISIVALGQLPLPGAWEAVFAFLVITAMATSVLVMFAARRRSGDYLGRLVVALDRVTGRRLEASRVVKFILDVEDVTLELLRGDRRRLVILTLLPLAGYLLMTIEVWLVFWAIGMPIGVIEGLAVETFARLISVASAGVPANIGTLEASNAAVVSAIGLGGGGSLALTRRVRALLWAALGLLIYPGVEAGDAPRARR